MNIRCLIDVIITAIMSFQALGVDHSPVGNGTTEAMQRGRLGGLAHIAPPVPLGTVIKRERLARELKPNPAVVPIGPSQEAGRKLQDLARDLANKREEIKRLCPLMWKEEYKQSFDVSSYQVAEEKLRAAERITSLVKDLNENLGKTKGELKRDEVDVSVYGNDLTSSGSFKTIKEMLFNVEYSLSFVRAIRYFEGKLGTFDIPHDFFNIGDSRISNYKKLRKIFTLVDIAGGATSDGQVDQNKLKKQMLRLTEGNTEEEIEDIKTAITSLRNDMGFKEAVRELGAEIDRKYYSEVKERNLIERWIKYDRLSSGYADFHQSFLYYLYASLHYDSKSEWGYGMIRGFMDLENEFCQLGVNATSSECLEAWD
jgi:hypothetical protein